MAGRFEYRKENNDFSTTRLKMSVRIVMTTVAIAAALVSAACDQSPTEATKPAQTTGGQEIDVTGQGEEVRNLPFARGRSFRTLDEYLAHLEQLGAIDLPYWRRVGPDLYERVATRAPRTDPERATRAELMRRYGFTR